MKPEGLNLGRQIGIHDVEAGEWRIDGLYMVLSNMCMSSLCEFACATSKVYRTYQPGVLNVSWVV